MTPKDEQAIELLTRVRGRLQKGPFSHLSINAHEFVACFLVCMEEMQKMQQEKPTHTS
jgi:hypothetical protein